jgi:hypothetical protein
MFELFKKLLIFFYPKSTVKVQMRKTLPSSFAGAIASFLEESILCVLTT